MLSTLLFVLTLLLFVLCIFMFKKIFSPSVLLSIVYLASSFFNIIGYKYVWNEDISFLTFIVIISGIIISIIIENLFIGLNKKKYEYSAKPINKLEFIKFNSVYKFCFIIVLIITVYLVISGIKRIQSFGTGNFIKNMFLSRESALYFEDNLSSNSIVSHLPKVVYSFSYVSTFIFLYNHYLQKKDNNRLKKNLIFLIPSIFMVVLTILHGERTQIVYYFCYLLVVSSVLSYKIVRSKNIISSLFKVFVFAIAALGIFSILSSFVGRTVNGLFNTLIGYFGSPIKALDVSLKSINKSNELIGERTFFSVYHFLQKIGLFRNVSISAHDEYAIVNNVIVGNVYTAYKSYIYDFGVIGFLILHIIFCVFYSSFYYRIFRMNLNNKNFNYKCILYGIFSPGLLLHFYSNFFFGIFLSFNYIIQILLVYLFVRIIILPRKKKLIYCKKTYNLSTRNQGV